MLKLWPESFRWVPALSSGLTAPFPLMYGHIAVADRRGFTLTANRVVKGTYLYN